MENADKMLKWSEELKAEMKDLPFDKDDIRFDFFGLLYDIGYSYYLGHMLLDITYFIQNGKVMFNESLSDYKKHIDRAVEISKSQLMNQSYYNSLNRNFLIGTWSNFELCVTTFCEAVTSTEEKSHILEHQLNDVLKTLKRTEINPDDLIRLKTLLKKDHLTHVPIVRKTDLLFKKAQGYSRNVEEDKEFLKFLGKFRNTFHTNFIYYGKDYEYRYEDKAVFHFADNEVVVWNDKYNGRPELYFDIKTTIKEIWKALILSIDHKELIPYPVSSAP
ncbi:MAG: hypothetical protein K0S44_1877 [Bacteroidetes bacterium]|jgi:hypothetical protein|nr:hypothetical protein [Bacteroidota bacterium]